MKKILAEHDLFCSVWDRGSSRLPKTTQEILPAQHNGAVRQLLQIGLLVFIVVETCDESMGSHREAEIRTSVWCYGAVALWCCGAVALWCCGAVVLWGKVHGLLICNGW
ncbi:hypothetical protein N9B17_02065 [Rhodopirellula sp.]|nr:hypothetical protein [Rhodopirellula sp.]